MAINKLPTSGPFNNIRQWLYEKTKVFTPNPMKPFVKDTTKEQKMNLTFLSDILTASHAPNGKINKLINEVNKLIQKVAKNETDISVIQKRLDIINNVLKLKSTTTHSHSRSRASITQMTDQLSVLKSQLTSKSEIDHEHDTSHEHDTTHEHRAGGKLQSGGKFTKSVTTSREENLKQKLINDIKKLQN